MNFDCDILEEQNINNKINKKNIKNKFKEQKNENIFYLFLFNSISMLFFGLYIFISIMASIKNIKNGEYLLFFIATFTNLAIFLFFLKVIQTVKEYFITNYYNGYIIDEYIVFEMNDVELKQKNKNGKQKYYLNILIKDYKDSFIKIKINKKQFKKINKYKKCDENILYLKYEDFKKFEQKNKTVKNFNDFYIE